MPMSAIWKCMAKAPSSIHGWMMLKNIRSPLAPNRATSKRETIASPRNFRHCISINSLYPHRSHRLVLSTVPLRNEAKKSLQKRSARPAMCHPKGGFYHDGRFATLNDVIEHYNEHLSL